MEIETEKLFKSEIAGVPVCYTSSECTVITDTGPHRRYGVLIEMGAERAVFPDIFPTAEDARDFLETLSRNGVTPATLGDIVYDYICR